MEKDKVEKAVEGFLNAWIANRLSDINRYSTSNDLSYMTKKDFYKRVILSDYDIASVELVSDVEAEIKLLMALNIRGNPPQWKQLRLYAKREKETWKIDSEQLMRH